jgi:hypothetical protein
MTTSPIRAPSKFCGTDPAGSRGPMTADRSVGARSGRCAPFAPGLFLGSGTCLLAFTYLVVAHRAAR